MYFGYAQLGAMYVVVLDACLATPKLLLRADTYQGGGGGAGHHGPNRLTDHLGPHHVADGFAHQSPERVADGTVPRRD